MSSNDRDQQTTSQTDRCPTDRIGKYRRVRVLSRSIGTPPRSRAVSVHWSRFEQRPIRREPPPVSPIGSHTSGSSVNCSVPRRNEATPCRFTHGF